MWGTDENWLRVAMHFPEILGYDSLNEKNVRERLLLYLNAIPPDRSYAKKLMLENGIWEQALQVAKEMDLNIQQ